MAYHQQRLLAIVERVSNPPANSDVTYGDERIINRAVRKTNDRDLWILSGDGESVEGSIVGFSYGMIQLAVDGWDVRFINSTDITLIDHDRLVGAVFNGERGFVRHPVDLTAAYDPVEVTEHFIARGSIVDGGPANQAGVGTVRAAIRYGG